MTVDLPICYGCKHFIPDSPDLTCGAFENGIPFVVLSSQHDHRQPYPGDNGIQFEPIEDSGDGRNNNTGN